MNESPEREEELFQQAVAAFEAGALETAEDLFRQVIAMSGSHLHEAETFLVRCQERRLEEILRGDGAAEAFPSDQSFGEWISWGASYEDPMPPPSPDFAPPSEPPSRGLPSPPSPFPVEAAQEVEAIPPGPEIFRRTPHMDILPEPPVAPETRLKVSVYTDVEPLRSDEEGDDVILEGGPDQNHFDVQVWLVVGAPFTIEGPDTRPLTILRDREKSESAEFTVVRGPGSAETQKAAFSAYFAHEGRACGRVSRAVPLAAGVAPVVAESAGVRIDARAGRADLNVRIVAREEDERAFECSVQTSLLPRYANGETATWRLKSLAGDLVGQQMERFTAPDTDNKVRTFALRAAGIQLFEAAPKIFQKVFWEMIDAGKAPRTISIVTEEPYIPWELMVPTRTAADGEEEQREPLGVEFLISRWTSREHIAAPQKIPIRDSWVMAPRDSRLANADDEAGMVLKEIPGERIDPASIALLDGALSRTGRTLLHVVCHGKSKEAGGQVLELENDEELDASYLRAMTGVKRAFRAGKPFVFLNACEVGREEPALVGVGGFAEQFMILGASGVIAPLWSVRDSIAHKVAVEFYERIEREPATPFAEILRDLRRRSYADEGGEDTWAAYTFYGDPLATRAG